MKKNILGLTLSIAAASSMLLAGCGGVPGGSGSASSNASSEASAASSAVSAASDAVTTQAPKLTKKPDSSEAASSEEETDTASASSASETPAPTATPEAELTDGTIHTSLTPAGDVYIAENRAFCPYYYADESGDAYSSMLNDLDSLLGDDVTVYNILAPTSFAVCLGQEIQDEMGCSSESYAIEYVNARVADTVKSVDPLETLISHNGEYVYFGTDHHWTQLAAYYTYRAWCEKKGITPHELSEYGYAEYPGFLGLFYDYSGYDSALESNPDTVQAYIPIATNDMTVTEADGSEYSYNIVSDTTDSAAGSKYSCFIGGDCALCSISNPNMSDGSACLLIKDSFGNAFAPFLVDHYQNTYVIDPRYYTGSITQFVAEHGISDVIFLYNVDQILGSTAEQVTAIF